MVILGIDPGSIITGYGVIEVADGTVRLLEYNVVRNRSSHSMPLRLKAIYSSLCDVIERTHPDELAIETAFYGKNAQSALKIGHARGVSILAAVNHELPTREYSPREVKKAVVGNGGASKEQVQFMVRRLLQLREAPKFFDATDALAVAICHVLRTGANKTLRLTGARKKHDWKEFVSNNPDRVKRA
jgi:crossover junction endodeoxyribonuclease RuvC